MLIAATSGHDDEHHIILSTFVLFLFWYVPVEFYVFFGIISNYAILHFCRALSSLG